MVSIGVAKNKQSPQSIEHADLPKEELRWCSVNLKEVLKRGSRLEASVFGVQGKHAREVLKQCKWDISTVAGENGVATSFYPSRFKRILVKHSDHPLILPSQIQELNPQPKGYLSPICKTDFELLRAKKGQILLTRSGTIGNCALVSRTLHGKTLSDDIIRITCKNPTEAGYLYAFLRSKIGKALIRTNEYGSVVSHIEPEHLEEVPIPNPPDILKHRIHSLVIRSYDLRDESNTLLENAQGLLVSALKLPPLKKLRPKYFDNNCGLRNYAMKLSQLNGRLEASYHIPIVKTILGFLKKVAAEITSIGDPRISKRIMLPGRFTRIYVQEGQGAIYFTGKHILELDPSDKKYLAFARHAQRIKDQLTIRENMLLITCSGTVGKVVLVPKHWDGWTMTHDIIRLVPSSLDIAAWLWVFLSSPYGQTLIRKFVYGSVVDHIETEHIMQVPVPLLKDKKMQSQISGLALKANIKRCKAYHLEQEAIRITNEEVIYAKQ